MKDTIQNVIKLYEIHERIRINFLLEKNVNGMIALMITFSVYIKMSSIGSCL